MIFTHAQTAHLHTQTFAYIEVEEANHVLTIRLNRPQAKNAMSPTMVREYAFAMSYAHHHAHIWAVVFAARGDVWCAGADLKAMRGQEEANQSTIPMPEKDIVIGDLFAHIHKPVIAQVHAPVYAGGHLLIGGCTHVIATPKVFFALPEVKRGIFPFQVMDMLLKILPARKVLDWCITGGTMSAEQALTMGLVTELVEESRLEESVNQLISRIFENSPSAIRLGLKAFDEMRSVAEADKQAFLKWMLDQTIQTADAQEGLKAFAEKRAPNWTGN
ncbi:MAG: enoyl-CoA hydratase-related protein [Microscillaceae bacterium]|jgi:enoyl-CoA hydratase/carnithine racemase|nr:enoyl-CoA hydratase-related protein [Microscillaceae bacterium]